jgi:hypothetical protein
MPDKLRITEFGRAGPRARHHAQSLGIHGEGQLPRKGPEIMGRII